MSVVYGKAGSIYGAASHCCLLLCAVLSLLLMLYYASRRRGRCGADLELPEGVGRVEDAGALDGVGLDALDEVWLGRTQRVIEQLQ